MSTVACYDQRYRRGYMARWPDRKLRRVAELLGSLPLPRNGRALDFGCGAGVGSGVLAATLPGWQVWGTDISSIALEEARERVPEARFVSPPDLEGAFDLIFSHHVLEHVTDLWATIAELGRLAAPQAAMLHILPCGNPGSLEHAIVERTPGGVTARGCWFYEDPTHERRVTTEALATEFGRVGFALRRAWYANQYYGAVEWITASGPAFTWRMLRSESRLRFRLTAVSVLRLPTRALVRFGQGYRRAVHYAGAAVGVLAYPVSAPVDNHIIACAEAEWAARREDPAGSEQYLYLARYL